MDPKVVGEYLRVKYSCESTGVNFEDCERITLQQPISLQECYGLLSEFALNNCYQQALKICDIYGIGALKEILGMMLGAEKIMPGLCWAEAINELIEGIY